MEIITQTIRPDLIDKQALIATLSCKNRLSDAADILDTSICTIADVRGACLTYGRVDTCDRMERIQLHPMTCVNCGGSIDTRSMTCRFCGTEYLRNSGRNDEDYSIYASF